MDAALRTLGGGTALALALTLVAGTSNALASGGPAGQSRGKKEAKEQVVLRPFRGGLEAARASAKERNVPLLLHVILEGEPQNDDYRDKILPHQELIDLSQRAVVIVSNNGQHDLHTIKETVEGEQVERQACTVYPWFENCHQHRECWDQIYAEWHDDDGDMRCPQTILLLPGGELSYRCNDGDPPPVGSVVIALKKAQKIAGPGLTEGELLHVKRALDRGRQMAAAQKWAEAWRSFQDVLAVATLGLQAEEAEAGSGAALAALNGEIEAARALLVPGKAAAGYARLVELAASTAGLPFEKELSAAIRKAEKQKDIEDEIERWKLEREAERLYAQACELLEQEQERKSEGLFRRLLRRKYAGTEAAKLTAERFPEWAAEEKAKGK